MSTETITSAILPNLASVMDVEMAVNKDGMLVIAYSEPFEDGENPSWAEFDNEKKSIIFYTEEGKTRDLGLKVWPIMEKHIKKSESAYFLCIQDKAIRNAEHLPFIVSKFEGVN